MHLTRRGGLLFHYRGPVLTWLCKSHLSLLPSDGGRYVLKNMDEESSQKIANDLRKIRLAKKTSWLLAGCAFPYFIIVALFSDILFNGSYFGIIMALFFMPYLVVLSISGYVSKYSTCPVCGKMFGFSWRYLGVFHSKCLNCDTHWDAYKKYE